MSIKADKKDFENALSNIQNIVSFLIKNSEVRSRLTTQEIEEIKEKLRKDMRND